MNTEKPFQQAFPHLFSPVEVNGHILKNRMVASPHSGGPNLYRSDGNGYTNMTETCAQYFGNIARGGAAIVNTGHLGVDPRYYLGSNCEMFNFFDKEKIHEHGLPVMHLMSDLIKSYGAVASFELNHCGPHGIPIGNDPLLGPMDMVMPNGIPVKAMTEADMDEVAEYFANAAYIGKRGGFDMINIHAAHSWLLGMFFSPINNKREDEYGGNWENRARFPKMVLERIRQAVGKDMLISMRFSVNESIPGGITIEEAANTIALLSPYIDIVQCSVGKIHNTLASGFLFPMPYMEHGCNAIWAREIKKRVGDKVLVETIGGVNQPEQADQFIEEGYCDLVASARSFIADPNWAEKARRGHSEDIRPCIRCLRCLNYANPPQTGTSICTVNPRRIIPHPLGPAEYRELNRTGKQVAVIGGGAAGMAAAIELADKGHRVTLYEKTEKLGGKLFFADYVSFKEDVRRYREYLITQVGKRERIQVLLGTEAGPEEFRGKGYEAIVVAIGAEPFIPPIPGADGPNVIHALSLYGHEDQIGDKVVIVGGGFVGCEASVHLQSVGKRVDVVEMTDELMKESIKDVEEERFFTLYYMKHEFDYHRHSFEEVPETDRVRTFVNAKCVRITEQGIFMEQNGEEKFLEADTVILSTGFRTDRKAMELYRPLALDVIAVGDADHVGDLRNTTFGAFRAAQQI